MNGTPTGLDYTAVLAVMQALKLKKKKQIFTDVQLIERGAITELSERDK